MGNIRELEINMEYNLLVNEEKVGVEFELKKEKDSLRAKIGDKSYDLTFQRVSDSQLHIKVNGQSLNIYTDGGETKTVIIDGRSYEVSDADLLDQSRSRKSSVGKEPTEVTPPMPAIVISVDVKEGDHVQKGDPVVVVSAMKMENTLTAPFSGTVTKINSKEGDKVMPGDILVDIVPDNNEEDGEVER